MSKYKTGDKVRVKSLDEVLEIEGVEHYDDVGDPWISYYMLEHFGKEGLITSCNENGECMVLFDEDDWFFKKEWLELVSTAKVEEIKNPTYDDLKHLFIDAKDLLTGGSISFNVSADYEEVKNPTYKTNSDRHRDLVNQIHDVYVDKNMKYGDAFAETIEKYGMIAALTRMNDKFNRIEQFIVNGFDDSEESLKDSLLDLANYCLMTVMEIDKK